MTDQGREQLAIAMGWTVERSKGKLGESAFWRDPDGNIADLPNPLTDANDDYAVLCWLRGVMPDDAEYGLFQRVTRHLPSLLDYQVGDVARATVKELCPTESEPQQQ